MKRINQYKKLFGVAGELELKTLKTAYRNLVKEWHPDKFQEGDLKREEAELQSRLIITNSGIADYYHKGMLLEITFLDGTTYEYFGVSKAVYHKMIQSDKLNRFAKRNIYPNRLYRKSKRTLKEA